jgi:hypothetical protein
MASMITPSDGGGPVRVQLNGAPDHSPGPFPSLVLTGAYAVGARRSRYKADCGDIAFRQKHTISRSGETMETS